MQWKCVYIELEINSACGIYKTHKSYKTHNLKTLMHLRYFLTTEDEMIVHVTSEIYFNTPANNEENLIIICKNIKLSVCKFLFVFN